jgi:hypothetical protein
MASRKTTNTAASQAAPHSWDTENWPPHVWPGSTSKARYTARIHRKELLVAGAVARVGRQLIFFGREYSLWLQSRRGKAAESHLPDLSSRFRSKSPAAAP